MISELVACLSVATAFAPYNAPKATAGFVSVLNGRFTDGTTQFHFGGDNIYWLGLLRMGTSQAEAQSEMTNCQAAGVRVVRTWAFSDGTADSLQPSLGTYNETALRVLDYAVYQASLHNVRLILALTNNWTDFGGMTWYVTQVEGGSNPNKNHFFTNPTCKQYFKQYINMLVNRTNVYTGVQYKNDPTIFSWECANEPRDEDDSTGNTLYNWYSEITSYIRSLDPNHMISTGEEGARKIAGSGADYLNNGGMGSDFARNVTLPNVSFGTIHLYLESWHKSDSWGQTYLADRATVARGAGKPIVLEEFGKKAPTAAFFDQWNSYCESKDYDGIMPWQMVDTLIDRSYDFLFTSPAGTSTKNMCTYQNSR